jgi:hypothetical protein
VDVTLCSGQIIIELNPSNATVSPMEKSNSIGVLEDVVDGTFTGAAKPTFNINLVAFSQES